MKLFLCLALFIGILLLNANAVFGQVNVGREYGNPKKPVLVLHLKEKNQRMLSRGYIPKHSVLGMILCFKWACRNEARRNKSLHAISFSKFQKKIRKNARKGAYRKTKSDSIRKKPVIKKVPQKMTSLDTVTIVREPDVVAPVLKTDSLIVLNEFLFETNSATLKSAQFSKLDSLMDFLIANPSLTVKISGHTDNTGRESHNQTLSTNRAKVVAEYLISNGVEVDRVSFIGLGSSKPLESNDTVKGRSKNRRVELLMHDKH
jgi:outer membrane protein OmpA-like peptidoglycan-associated protein